MSNFPVIRPGAVWAANSVLISSELQALDQMRPKLINASDGSTHSPTSVILISDGNGFGIHSQILKGGKDGANESFKVQNTTITVANGFDWNGDIIFNDGVDVGGDFSCGPAVIIGPTNLSGTTTHSGSFVNSGPGTITTAGNKLTITGTAPPIHTGAIVGYVRCGAVLPNLTTFDVTHDPPGLCVGKFGTTSPSVSQKIYVDLHLNYNVSYGQLNVVLVGDPTHGALPLNMPTIQLFRHNSFTGVLTSLGSATAFAASNPVYISTGAVATINFGTLFQPGKNERFTLEIVNEGGANSVGGLVIKQISFAGDCVTFGNTGDF